MWLMIVISRSGYYTYISSYLLWLLLYSGFSVVVVVVYNDFIIIKAQPARAQTIIYTLLWQPITICETCDRRTNVRRPSEQRVYPPCLYSVYLCVFVLSVDYKQFTHVWILIKWGNERTKMMARTWRQRLTTLSQQRIHTELKSCLNMIMVWIVVIKIDLVANEFLYTHNTDRRCMNVAMWMRERALMASLCLCCVYFIFAICLAGHSICRKNSRCKSIRHFPGIVLGYWWILQSCHGFSCFITKQFN